MNLCERSHSTRASVQTAWFGRVYAIIRFYGGWQMNIVMQSLATANPPRYATQKETYEYLASHFDLKPREKQLYAKILLDGPIKGRYFGIDYDEQMCETSPEALIERFLKFGKQIGTEAAKKAMDISRFKSG